MISTCPSCLNRVDHRDDLKEVVCECGDKFATFYDAPPDESSSNEAPVEPSFDESFSAFAEIRDFGEGLNDSKSKEKAPALEPAPEPSMKAMNEVTGVDTLAAPIPAAMPTNPAECLMTAASEFPGVTVQEYLMPVSVFAELGAEDPLKPAFQALSEAAARQGANGVVGVHWNLTTDKVLIAGTPVKLQK